MRLRGWTLGLIFVVLVAVIWNFSTVLVQTIFGRFHFFRPVFLTYVANSLFVVLLPLRALGRMLRRLRRGTDDQSLIVGGVAPRSAELRAAAKSALIVCPIWFAANATYNLSVGMTSLTASTVISASSAAFTLLLSVWLLREPATALKLAGVALCWAGNGLTAVGDTSSAGTLGGDAVCLLSAALYAVYTVAIRMRAPDDLALFFGLLGAFNAVIFAPLVLVLHFTGAEDLGALSWEIGGLLVGKGLVDNVLSDYLWAQAVLLTSPAVATVGLSLTVPLAVLSQLTLPKSWMMHAAPLTWASAVSAVLVVAGFVALAVAGERRGGDDEARTRSERCWRALNQPLLRRAEPRSDGGEPTPTLTVVPSDAT